jgi:hypothetical protein
MPGALLVTVRFHDGRYHGSGDWPPSPARLFQAAVPLQGLGGLDLRSGGGPLLVSADGATAQVDAWQHRHAYRFALGERRVDIDPAADHALLAPITHAPDPKRENFVW